MVYQEPKHVVVGGSLGQPERLGFTTKTKPEVSKSPNDLRHSIAFIAKRQDRMAVSLRDRVPMTTSFRSAHFVGF
jgi:hypothetical protein